MYVYYPWHPSHSPLQDKQVDTGWRAFQQDVCRLLQQAPGSWDDKQPYCCSNNWISQIPFSPEHDQAGCNHSHRTKSIAQHLKVCRSNV